MKKINNKGYMLVEIILAFAITFVLIYFVMDLIIKFKNKNDDLMVETLVKTDQTIITNELMSYAIDEKKNFNCDTLKQGITENSVKYKNDMIDIVSKYAKIDVSRFSCSVDSDKISIRIPISVAQINKENFDVVIDYKYKIRDMIPPSCTLAFNESTIVATYSDNEGGSGIKYYGWDSSYSGNNNETTTMNGIGTYTFYVMDEVGNTGSCSGTVTATVDITSCPAGCYKHNGYCATGVSAERPCGAYIHSYECESGTKLNDNYCYTLE